MRNVSLRRLCGLFLLTNTIACASAGASDLIFMQGFGNVSVFIDVPPDGSTIGGALPTFTGSASVAATLVWTNSETGYMGTGEEIPPCCLVEGPQRLYLKATTADGDFALAESDVTYAPGP